MGCGCMEMHRWLQCSCAAATASPEEPGRAPLLQPVLPLSCLLSTASPEVQSGRQHICTAIVSGRHCIPQQGAARAGGIDEPLLLAGISAWQAHQWLMF